MSGAYPRREAIDDPILRCKCGEEVRTEDALDENNECVDCAGDRREQIQDALDPFIVPRYDASATVCAFIARHGG